MLGKVDISVYKAVCVLHIMFWLTGLTSSVVCECQVPVSSPSTVGTGASPDPPYQADSL